jgi:hypothetical protein
MAIKAVLEFAVGLSTFRNIDLLHQGAYAVRVSATVQAQGAEAQALPYAISASQSRKRRSSLHCILPGSIDDRAATVVSRRFLIRYVDEVVFLLDFAVFRISVDPQWLDQLVLVLDFELLYGDVPTQGSEELLREAGRSTSLLQVSKTQVQLADVAYCQRRLVPVIFPGSAFARLGVVFHSALVDYHYQVGAEGVKSDRCREDLSQSLANFLFKAPDGRRCDYVSGITADSVYRTFISTLTKSYKTLRKVYKAYSEHSHASSWRTLSAAYSPPHLSLPGSPAQLPYVSGKTSLLSSIAATDPNESFDSDSMSDIAEETPHVPVSFSNRVASNDPVQLALTLALELNVVASQIHHLWSRTQDMVQANLRAIESVLYAELERDRVDLLSSLCQTSHRSANAFSSTCALRRFAELDVHAARIREAFRQEHARHVLVQTELQGDTVLAALFEEVTLRTQCVLHGMTPLPCIDVSSDDSVSWSSDSDDTSATSSRKHIVVLVHGFRGTSFDMLIIKRFFGLYFPQVAVLLSTANEGRTDDDILLMGQRLASEVRAYLTSQGNVGYLKLSFIGHSLGGLIVRAAIPELQEYQYALNAYMSLGTPHLGYVESGSTLIATGLWVLQTWGRSLALKQLAGKDGKKITDTLLWKLAVNQSLARFRSVLLVASHQDSYVPYDSARLEVSPQSDPQRSINLTRMADAALSGFRTSQLHRIDAVIPATGQLLDNWLGRTAHVQLLESPTAIAALLCKFHDIFA